MSSVIRRGEIYWVQLDPAIGSEIKKTRPALVVSNDQNNEFSELVTVLPITSQASKVYPFEVLLEAGQGGIKAKSKVKANQIRTVDKRRLSLKSLGTPLDADLMAQITKALSIHLEIDA